MLRWFAYCYLTCEVVVFVLRTDQEYRAARTYGYSLGYQHLLPDNHACLRFQFAGSAPLRIQQSGIHAEVVASRRKPRVFVHSTVTRAVTRFFSSSRWTAFSGNSKSRSLQGLVIHALPPKSAAVGIERVRAFYDVDVAHEFGVDRQTRAVGRVAITRRTAESFLRNQAGLRRLCSADGWLPRREQQSLFWWRPLSL